MCLLRCNPRTMYVQETVTSHMFDQLGVQNWNDLLCILLILSVVLTRGHVGASLVPCGHL